MTSISEVVDEVHWVTTDPTGPLFNAVGALAKRTPRLLMLSATPSLTNQRAYLGLLHLLDPDVYRLDDIAGFRQRLALRAELAQMMLTFKPSLPNFHLRRVVRRLIEQFPNDQPLAALADNLSGILEHAAGLTPSPRTANGRSMPCGRMSRRHTDCIADCCGPAVRARSRTVSLSADGRCLRRKKSRLSNT